jgi:hypothetical protein
LHYVDWFKPPAAVRDLRGHPARRTRDGLLPSERQPRRGRLVNKPSLRTHRGGSGARLCCSAC